MTVEENDSGYELNERMEHTILMLGPDHAKVDGNEKADMGARAATEEGIFSKGSYLYRNRWL